MKTNHHTRVLRTGVFLLAPMCLTIVPAPTANAAAAETSQSSVSAPATPPAAKPRPIVVKRMPGPSINNDCPSFPDAQVRNLSCPEAAELVERLKEAQLKLKNGDQLLFELSSGAPASDPMTKVSPRDAFLKMPFEKAVIVERLKTDNRLWQPYRLTYRPESSNGMIWDVQVTMGYIKPFERVEMRYRPPAPY